MKVDHLLYAGNSLEKTRQLFDDAANIGRGTADKQAADPRPAAVTCLRLVGPLGLMRRARSHTRGFFQEFRGGAVGFF